jgi:OOP family OmpA-OmpF porin
MRWLPFVLSSLLATATLAQMPPARLGADRIELLTPISFETGGAVLTPEGHHVLDAVVGILRANPGMRIEIGVHTDSRGADAFNQRVSQERADAIRAFLVGRGVSAARLTAVGYGETRPIDTNSTEAGRARNRRVELLIVR